MLKHCIAAVLTVVSTLSTLSFAATMGEDDARHLLNRTGFGAPPQAVTAYAALSRHEAVERLLGAARTAPLQAPPALPFEPLYRRRELDEAAREEALRLEFQRGAELRAWWLQEMLQTPSPITERMTLFWHNHFVSSQQKVKSARLLLDQNLLLRRYALGNFGDLLHAVAKDPAMLIYLDAATNRKGQPNENFAREVMELFTLGEGRYSERDIQEAARAFTGWSLDRETGSFVWRPRMHDEGEKIVLGRRGNFNGEEVLDILLQQPVSAEFIVAKLWREFVSPTPNPAELSAVAERFRASRYDIRQALRALLTTRAFWAAENRGSLVKSPVDLVVGSMRTLDVAVPDALPLAFAVRNLGQDLFAPPNVRGWPGGEAWISATTLLGRKQFVERLLRSDERPAPVPMQAGMLRQEIGKGVGRLDDETRQRMARAVSGIRFDSARWLARFPVPDRGGIERALLPVPAVAPPAADVAGIERVRALVLDPTYQLK
jgi:uncharacterized protein (DUF1800 family)